MGSVAAFFSASAEPPYAIREMLTSAARHHRDRNTQKCVIIIASTSTTFGTTIAVAPLTVLRTTMESSSLPPNLRCFLLETEEEAQ